jgi:hypothetical protein
MLCFSILITLQVFGAYFCAQIAARKFIELGIKGSIVMTSSMTSYRPNRVRLKSIYGCLFKPMILIGLFIGCALRAIWSH